jgi:hypothetical protein
VKTADTDVVGMLFFDDIFMWSEDAADVID